MVKEKKTSQDPAISPCTKQANTNYFSW